jgi:hypothetical protein
MGFKKGVIMIFEEKEYKADDNVKLLTWDKANAILLGEDYGKDIKSVKLEIEAGELACVIVEVYEKSTMPVPITTKKSFAVGFDQAPWDQLTIPIYRMYEDQKDENQLEFEFDFS